MPWCGYFLKISTTKTHNFNARQSIVFTLQCLIMECWCLIEFYWVKFMIMCRVPKPNCKFLHIFMVVRKYKIQLLNQFFFSLFFGRTKQFSLISRSIKLEFVISLFILLDKLYEIWIMYWFKNNTSSLLCTLFSSNSFL